MREHKKITTIKFLIGLDLLRNRSLEYTLIKIMNIYNSILINIMKIKTQDQL